MVKLIAKTPCAELLPLSAGGVELIEVLPDRLVSVAPFAGRRKTVSEKLEAQFGVGLPATNRSNEAAQWFGHGIWLVRQDVDLAGIAAVTDQSDAWAVVSISGAGVEDVLARLVPVDLRLATFKTGHTARTMLGHMSVAISRVGAQSFEIMAMRSMAGTLVHELETAMRSVALR
ncbi:MAG: sarcosine oxidase subunit gamma [Pseudomonadota bacterium]